jgi:hypothetical protein
MVTLTGLITLMFAAYMAMFKDDLKGLLAYSTVSHLGLITLLLGSAARWRPLPPCFIFSTMPPSRPGCSCSPASSIMKPVPGI